jgi:hypothetical protein
MSDECVQLDRGVFESEVWLKTPFSDGQALVDLLAHSDDASLHTTQVMLAVRWGWSRRMVARRLNEWAAKGLILLSSELGRDGSAAISGQDFAVAGKEPPKSTRDFIKLWFKLNREYDERVGRKRVEMFEPKDAMAAKRIAKALPEDKWEIVINRDLDDTDSFAVKLSWPLWLLASRVNGYLMEGPPKDSEEAAIERVLNGEA